MDRVTDRVRDKVRDRDMGRVRDRVRLRGLAIAAPSYSGTLTVFTGGGNWSSPHCVFIISRTIGHRLEKT